MILIGPPAETEVDQSTLDAALIEALQTMPVKQAANMVAEAFGLSKREAYQRALTLKSDV